MFWWVTAISVLFSFGYFLAAILGKPKPVQSRHKLFTLSGALSRMASFFALRWANNPNDFFPITVFVYGMVELFGVSRSVKTLLKFNKHMKRRANVTRSKKEADLHNLRNRA